MLHYKGLSTRTLGVRFELDYLPDIESFKRDCTLMAHGCTQSASHPTQLLVAQIDSQRKEKDIEGDRYAAQRAV